MKKRENNPVQREITKSSINSTNKSTGTPSLLEKVTDILKCLVNGINSATEIAEYCDYSISTVHRLLQELSELGWTIQDETSNKFFLGTFLHRLASNVTVAHQYLILHALKEMNILSRLTQESVVLAALEQMRIVILNDFPSSRNLGVIESDRVRDRAREMYVGATAKVLLSQLNDKALANFFRHIKVESITSESTTDADAMFQQIKEIRQKGYGISCGERMRGVICIAAPVKHYFCPAVLYIIGPEDRITPKIDDYTAALLNSANRITEGIAGIFTAKEENR